MEKIEVHPTEEQINQKYPELTHKLLGYATMFELYKVASMCKATRPNKHCRGCKASLIIGEIKKRANTPNPPMHTYLSQFMDG